MKKLKLYTLILLVLSMIVSSCSMAFAAGAVEYGFSWILHPVSGVTGHLYSSTPYGFIVHAENGTSALVNEYGVVIPQTDKLFSDVSEDGLIEYRIAANEDAFGGVMDVSGNIIFPASENERVSVINKDLFCLGKMDDEYTWHYSVIDKNKKEIIPAKYDYIKWWGTILACDSEGKQYVYDLDGKLVGQYDENTEIRLLPLKDRYLIVSYENGESTKIVHINGKTLGVVPYALIPVSPSRLRAIEFYDGNMKLIYYDYSGSFITLDTITDSSEYYNVTDEYSPVDEKGYTVNYKYVDYEPEYYIAKNGIFVCKSPVNNAETVYNNALIKYADEYYETYGIVDFNGNEMVPLGKYENIRYCEERDVYAFEKDGKISIGKIRPVKVKVKGKTVKFDQNPVIKDGRTLVPVRAIFEAMGANVEWNEAKKTVKLTLGDKVVKLVINSNVMKVNTKEIKIDVPAEIINGRTLVPVRAISEALGCNVKWDASSRSVTID